MLKSTKVFGNPKDVGIKIELNNPSNYYSWLGYVSTPTDSLVIHVSDPHVVLERIEMQIQPPHSIS